jgi:hypothetical protein
MAQVSGPTVWAARRLLHEADATDVVVRCLDDGVAPSPLWIAQAMWKPNARVPLAATRHFGVAINEVGALIELAADIFSERLCPYCGRESMVQAVPSVVVDPDSEMGRAIAAGLAEQDDPYDFECWYEWEPQSGTFALHCIEG